MDAVLCNRSCVSVGFDGGKSFTSLKENKGSYRPGVFTHEFQHQFAGLADEYVAASRGGDQPKYPNCAADAKQAQAWWGAFIADGSAGTYDGCSYVEGNVRPHETSLMRVLTSRDIGVVSAAHIRAKLASYTGEGGRWQIGLLGRLLRSLRAAVALPIRTEDEGEQGIEITFKLLPDGTYGIAGRRPVVLPHGVKPSMDQGQSVTVHVGQYQAFTQTFEPAVTWGAESFETDGTVNIKQRKSTPAEEVTVQVGLGNFVINEAGYAIAPDGSQLPTQISATACDSTDDDADNNCPPPTFRGAEVPRFAEADAAHAAAPVCGNGIVESGEECDGSEGCNVLCLRERPTALQKLSHLFLRKRTECGDGRVDEGEECDDGNVQDGDGCSGACFAESPIEDIAPVQEEPVAEEPSFAPQCANARECPALSAEDRRRCLDTACSSGQCSTVYRCSADGSVCDGNGRCIAATSPTKKGFTREQFFEYFRRRGSDGAEHSAAAEDAASSSASLHGAEASSSASSVIVVGEPQGRQPGIWGSLWEFVKRAVGWK